MLRTFIAVEPASDVKDLLGGLQRELRNVFPGARWTRAEGMHLTLKFLGDTPEAKIAGNVEALREAVAGEGAFDVRLTGIGAFPNPGRARVLWVGTDEGAENLKRLAARVDDAVAAHGFPRESRPFAPHFTLARFRDGAKIPTDVIAKLFEARFRAAEIIYYRSELLPAGARYTVLGRVPLMQI